MSDLILTEKENIVKIADAVRAITGKQMELTFEDIENAIYEESQDAIKIIDDVFHVEYNTYATIENNIMYLRRR